MIFSCGFSCQCPCPHCEAQLISAYPESPPIPVSRSLDLLWALWGQLRLWLGLTPACTCPQSPQLPQSPQPQLWEQLLSIQVFHRFRVYPVYWGDLIHYFWGCMGIFPFVFFGHTAPGVQFWFWSHLCVWAALRHLFPAQARGRERSCCLGVAYWFRLGGGRNMAVTVGMWKECLRQQRPVWSCKSLRPAIHSPSEVGPEPQDPRQWQAAQTAGKV